VLYLLRRAGRAVSGAARRAHRADPPAAGRKAPPESQSSRRGTPRRGSLVLSLSVRNLSMNGAPGDGTPKADAKVRTPPHTRKLYDGKFNEKTEF